jgi:hypothetical protein
VRNGEWGLGFERLQKGTGSFAEWNPGAAHGGRIKQECRHPPTNLHHPGKKIAAGVPPQEAKIIKPAEEEPYNMLFTLT